MNFELLRGKFLLLDTNFLINYTKYPHLLERVRLSFVSVEATLILDEIVRFEYMRNAGSNDELGKLRNFLMLLLDKKEDEVDKPEFIFSHETITDATKISNLYVAVLKNSKVPPVDCFLAAQMKKYSNNLVLVTSDHTDFPPILFDRIGIETIDTGSDIINIGFYTFDLEKYNVATSRF